MRTKLRMKVPRSLYLSFTQSILMIMSFTLSICVSHTLAQGMTVQTSSSSLCPYLDLAELFSEVDLPVGATLRIELSPPAFSISGFTIDHLSYQAVVRKEDIVLQKVIEKGQPLVHTLRISNCSGRDGYYQL